MVVESARYTDQESSVIEAVIDGQKWSVPTNSANWVRLNIALWEAQGGQIQSYVPTDDDGDALSLKQVASAKLTVDGWDISGIERSRGFSGAFIADTDTAWVFFSEEQPDANYVLIPDDGFTKFNDHVEVTRPGLADLSFLVFRVQ